MLVGTGSAALAGLVFVAISVNLRGVLSDATHTYRAINMLSRFTSAFVISCLGLTGHQTHRTLGVEWLIAATLAAAVNTNGYVKVYRGTGSRYALNRVRAAGGTLCFLGQIVGSAAFCLGWGAGLYVAAIALVANFYFLVSGSWLLIVGTLRDAE